MKIIVCSFLSLLFAIVMISSLSASNYAGVNIIVADLSGIDHAVNDADEPLSIDVAVSGDGLGKWYRIRAANIAKAIFTHTKIEASVSVFMKDGTRIVGRSTQQGDVIRGKGPTMIDFCLPMAKVKKIVFLSTHVPEEFQSQGILYSTWKITDGYSTLLVKTLLLIDSFLDNRDFENGGTMGHFDKRSVWHGLASEKLLLTQGEASLEISFNDIARIEITGRSVNGRPELRLKLNDGSSLNAGLEFWSKCDDSKVFYTGFEDEDYYAWEDKPFGIRAISLKPLRKIVFEKSHE